MEQKEQNGHNRTEMRLENKIKRTNDITESVLVLKGWGETNLLAESRKHNDLPRILIVVNQIFLLLPRVWTLTTT